MENTYISNNREPQYRQLTSLVIYLFVCLCFIIKYSARINTLSIPLFCILFITFVWLVYKSNFNNKLITIVMLLYSLAFGIIVPLIFPVGTFNLDRWDMIEAFNNALIHGEYPYSQRGIISDNQPAQSPVYFLLCFPFYLTKWYVGIPLVGMWLFYWCLNRLNFVRNKNTTLLPCLFSPFFIYETLTCSSIFFNSALLLLWITFIKQGMFNSPGKYIIHGIIGGFLLCTRNCFAIPILIIWITMIKTNSSKLNIFIWGISIALTFFLLYLPFIFGWGPETWINANPFKVQTNIILGIPTIIIIFMGSIISSLYSKDLVTAIFLSGLWLFLSAFFTFIETIFRHGFQKAYVSSHFDITYLILGIPFIACFLFHKKLNLTN